MSISIRTLLAGFALALSALVSAQTKTSPANLAVGDDAPAISVAKWVKGAPVESFDKGKVYVVEFWATWCGPCKVSIPHLTELQKKFGDKATFIGVSAFENDWNAVEPFVKSEGDQMDYNVAMDKVSGPKERVGDMGNNWMIAAHQNGIPTAFVVDRDGKIAWIGHPMELEKPLTDVVAGTWDRAKAAKSFKSQIDAQENSPLQKLSQELNEDVKAKNWPAALKAVDAHEADLPGGQANLIRMQIYMHSGDDAKYSALGEKMVSEYKGDPMMLNQIAWPIVDPNSSFKHRDLKLALAAASKAVELTQHQNPDLLDTLAWAYHWKGDKKHAVDLETEAAAKAPENQKDNLLKTLKKFSGEG